MTLNCDAYFINQLIYLMRAYIIGCIIVYDLSVMRRFIIDLILVRQYAFVLPSSFANVTCSDLSSLITIQSAYYSIVVVVVMCDVIAFCYNW